MTGRHEQEAGGDDVSSGIAERRRERNQPVTGDTGGAPSAAIAKIWARCLAVLLLASSPEHRGAQLPVRHIFVVGCTRSRTTLLQSFLAAHRLAYSVPEAHSFYRLARHRRDDLAGAHRVVAPRPRPTMERRLPREAVGFVGRGGEKRSSARRGAYLSGLSEPGVSGVTDL